MATNPYITKGYRPEQNLYEDIVIESLQFYGQDVYYLPREILTQDKIFKDEVESRFTDAYKIEMYIENMEGFDGQGDLFTKFGVEIRDQATFVVARKRWKNLIGAYLEEKNFRPREGDLIYLSLSKSMFEIMKVETETPFYQLNQLPTFRLQCELFEYNDEEFYTLVDDIDEIAIDGAYKFNLQMITADSATAEALLTIDNNGRVVSTEITKPGTGYFRTPDITVSNVPIEVARFGNSSLNLGLYRRYILDYSKEGNGAAEFFFFPTALPDSNQYAGLFTTGGDSAEKSFIWGLDAQGNLVYNKFSDDSTDDLRFTSGEKITVGQWNHILVGNDGVVKYAYINGSRVLNDSSEDSANFIANAAGLGLETVGLIGGVGWNLASGYIDEFRGRVGNRTTLGIFDSTGITVPSAAFDDDEETNAALEHFTARKPSFAIYVDSDQGTVSSLVILDSGDLYPTPATVTIASPYGNASYVDGEEVQQINEDYTIKGTVLNWSDSDFVLSLYNVGSTDGKYHTFTNDVAVIGQTSLAQFAPTSSEEVQDIQKSAQNKIFDDFEADFLDFSESNPFGDMQ
jgi:hypothetical protein